MRRLKAVLVCLLVLAFPLRAYAGWAMAFCGMGHHGAAQTLAQQEGLSKDHPAAQTLADAPCAVHSGGAADSKASVADEGGDIGAAGDANAPDAAASPSEKHLCSACASCCSAAVLLPALPVLLEPDFVPTAFAAMAPHWARRQEWRQERR
jgi:hypothetical protein